MPLHFVEHRGKDAVWANIAGAARGRVAASDSCWSVAGLLSLESATLLHTALETVGWTQRQTLASAVQKWVDKDIPIRAEFEELGESADAPDLFRTPDSLLGGVSVEVALQPDRVLANIITAEVTLRRDLAGDTERLHRAFSHAARSGLFNGLHRAEVLPDFGPRGELRILLLALINAFNVRPTFHNLRRGREAVARYVEEHGGSEPAPIDLGLDAIEAFVDEYFQNPARLDHFIRRPIRLDEREALSVVNEIAAGLRSRLLSGNHVAKAQSFSGAVRGHLDGIASTGETRSGLAGRLARTWMEYARPHHPL